LGSREAAKDAVQQGMLKSWEARQKLESCENKTAFVFTVVRNICLDELKRKRPLYVDDLTRVQSTLIETTSQNDHNEAAELVKKIIVQLPSVQQEVISLRDIDGLDFEEIAEILDIGVPHARVLLSRARKKVREQLEKWYQYESIQTR
jgi:RNA polymerase sigma factor (sigma-70 family)